MSSSNKNRLIFISVLLIGQALQSAGAAGCPISYTSGVAQFGAASGGLANPIGGPSECSLSPGVSAYNALALGGTEWQGTGVGGYGINSSSYYFKSGSGWWGYSVASMGMFYFPDLIITGGPASSVSGNVNVAYGGTAIGDGIPALQNVKWAVDILDLTGGTYASYFTDLYYTPNGPVLSAASGLLSNLPVNTPFALQVRTQWYHAGPAGGAPDISGEMFLQLMGDGVFTLPEGYTVNSSSAGIVDNVFSAAVVPIPAAVWLFTSALGLLAGVRGRLMTDSRSRQA